MAANNSFALMVGLRYSRAKQSNRFISFIGLVSMLGIALGTIVLITVMSVINGFQFELQERILGMVPHVVIRDRGPGLKNWTEIESKILRHPDVVSAAPFIDFQAIFKAGNKPNFGLVYGIYPSNEEKVSIVGKHFIKGSLDNLKPGEQGIILGSGTANKLRVDMGDTISLVIPNVSEISSSGFSPKHKRFTIVGIFEVRTEADNYFNMIHIDDAAKITQKGNFVSALRITIKDVISAPWVAYELRKQLDETYDRALYVGDWNASHGTLFKAVKMQKSMMGILLTLIIVVAAFNIVTTLVMVVSNKQSDIAILRTLGASPATIMRIFIIQGCLNGLIGTTLGVICGVALALNLPDLLTFVENFFGLHVLSSNVYPINFLPSEVQWLDVIMITAVAFSLTVIATLYPAWSASKTNPAEALRYE